jgi:hypothetical protein
LAKGLPVARFSVTNDLPLAASVNLPSINACVRNLSFETAACITPFSVRFVILLSVLFYLTFPIYTVKKHGFLRTTSKSYHFHLERPRNFFSEPIFVKISLITRLSCHDFVDNQVRLQLFALAYNLGNFLRRLALPKRVKEWSLRTLRVKLKKIGAKVVKHARYVTFQMAEVLVSKRLFEEILERIHQLKPVPIGYG